ncbi:dynein regulatory complex subunit 5 isoform X2 [Anas platyrhynchos]|uniref:dynein regulatory complex subunit 5 isoform X2 n=1 Tax=Anas platyrhynchos TaxID=8839 RepID=UPI003AF2EB84
MQQAAGRSRPVPSLRRSQSRLTADSYCIHRIIEDPEWSLAAVPQLTELCLQHIVHNFTQNPILDRLLPEHQRKVLDRLPTALPLAVTANLVSDEDYWKRCCTERWQVLELIPLCKDYVRKLEVDQFLPPLKVDPEEEADDISDSESDLGLGEVPVHHYDLGALVTALPYLEELHLTYGVKDCGMNFEWNLFKFTYQDCCNLAGAVKKCHKLKVFKLTRSNVDDDKTKLLVRSLLDHPALVELNLSHNLIGDTGAQAVGKLINRSKLETLDLCNNKIHQAGAQALAQALAQNCILTSLNLRLNYLGDEGGEAMGRALLANATLKSIHLGSNMLSEPSAVLLSQVLAQNATLTSINLSCNHIGPDGGKQLLEGLAGNKTLTEFDLRLAEVGQENEFLIGQMLWANRHAARLAPQPQPPAEPL